MLLMAPGFVEVYAKNGDNILNARDLSQVHEDFGCQLAKVTQALMSGEYSRVSSRNP